MTFDDVVVLICAALWLVHLIRLARVGVRRVWRSWALATLGLGITLVAWLLLPRGAWLAAAAPIALWLVIPAFATRAASRALRFGRPGRARVLAWLSYILRPVPAQRVFVHAVELTGRLARGEELDIEGALDALQQLRGVDKQAQRLALLSWTNDYPAMAALASDPPLRDYALRTGMSAIVVAALAETSDRAALVELYERLERLGVVAHRQLDSRWSLLLLAAHLGGVELVEEHILALCDEVPPDRIAFLRATALLRADRSAAAFEVVDAALRAPTLSANARMRLLYRIEHPLPAARVDEQSRAMLSRLAGQLHVQRALSVLGFTTRQRAPLTVAMGLSIAATYLLQLGMPGQEVVFRRWGLIAPFERAPDVFRLLSYAWLHLDGGHLTVNMLGLLLFGRFVEAAYGRVRFLVVYVVGAVAGGLAYLAFEPGFGVAIGASGAVLALFGASAAHLAGDARVRATKPGRRELVFLALIALSQLVIDAMWPQSAGSAHAGGLAAGLLFGLLLDRLRRKA